jgi:hypothetical protein
MHRRGAEERIDGRAEAILARPARHRDVLAVDEQVMLRRCNQDFTVHQWIAVGGEARRKLPARASISGSTPGLSALVWTAISREAGIPAGRLPTSRNNGSNPPADAPMTMRSRDGTKRD